MNEWEIIFTAVISSSVVAAIISGSIKHFSDRNKQDVDFRNDFRKEAIKRHFESLEEVAKILENIRLSNHLSPNFTNSNLEKMNLSDKQLKTGVSYHKIFDKNIEEVRSFLKEIDNTMSKELWMKYEIYAILKQIRKIIGAYTETQNSIKFKIENYKSLEELRLRLQIQINKSQGTIENLEEFLKLKTERAEKRLEDFLNQSSNT